MLAIDERICSRSTVNASATQRKSDRQHASEFDATRCFVKVYLAATVVSGVKNTLALRPARLLRRSPYPSLPGSLPLSVFARIKLV